MQALRNKYKGKEQELKEEIILYGCFEAAHRQNQKPTQAWSDYCKEIVGDEPFSYVTETMLQDNEELEARVATEMFNILLRQAARIKQLESALEESKRRYEIEQAQKKLKTIKLLNQVNELG
jgi:hypothetical protein